MSNVRRGLNAGDFAIDVSVDCSGGCRHFGRDKDLAETAAANARPGVDAKAGKDIMMELFERKFDLIGERRQDRRYECQLPMRYRSSQERDCGAGTATDISRGGIALHIPRTLMRGSAVELIVDWPSMSDKIGNVKLQIVGRVLRSDSSRTVIAIEKHEFVRDRFSGMPLDDRRAVPTMSVDSLQTEVWAYTA